MSTKAAPAPRLLRSVRFWQTSREALAGYAMVGPAVLLLAGLVGVPILMALYLSLTNAQVGRPGVFIGLGNFLALWRDSIFWATFWNSLLFTGAAVSLKTVLGLAAALLLHQPLVGRQVYRGLVLLPWIIPTAFSTLGWWWMFDPLYSVINWTLIHLGVISRGLPWMAEPVLAKTAVVMVNTWRGLPFFAVGLLAGLAAIPRELYEAAQTDGAGPLARFRFITLPLLAPVLLTIILFSTIMTISDFNIVYVLTRGGPMNTTHMFATLAYQVGLVSGELGRGAAISLFIFPVLLVGVFLLLRVVRRSEVAST
ncbi:MAG: sugar ABC transporter permease [Armatimonadota bacterium]|nr:sugar ABC transporter permease [Armatimonadota bacterium]